MNLELLKKLVRLANNNPNEHEANAASRRACKMIAENDFAIFKNSVENLQDQYTVRTPPQTYADVRRSAEPEFKSKPQETSYAKGPFDSDAFRDLFNRATRNPFYRSSSYWEAGDYRNIKCRVCHKYKDTEFVEKESEFMCSECMGKANTEPKYHPNDAKYYEQRKKRGFGDEKQPLKCKTCGQIKLTLFIGLPDLFECNFCQWTAFEKDREIKK